MKEFFNENKGHLVWLSVILILLSLLPVFESIVYIGSHWAGFPPSYTDDAYYYVRMKEIVDGHPLLGNPYFIEHASGIAPAFVFPDWIYALPLLAGFPLMTAISINFTFWSLVFGSMLYIFFRKFELSKMWSVTGVLFCYTQVYIFVLRPVSMQIVYPVFFLFMIAWYAWERFPEKRNNITFLAFATALAFYDYAYLWQIIVVFLGLMFIYLLRSKRSSVFKSFFVTGVLTCVMIIPFIFFTLKQLQHPFYWETMRRISLVSTHLPTARVLYVGFWIFALVCLLLLSQKWLPTLRKYTHYARFAAPYSLFGVAMVVVSVSNVITGKEMETANHVERFMTLWLSMGAVVWSYYFFQVRKAFPALPVVQKFLLTLTALLVILGNLLYAGDLGTFLHPKERMAYALQAQEYIPALKWIDTQESKPVVIWVSPNSTLASVLPIFTKHYLLFANPGILHLMSDDEVQERYLVAAALENPTAESINKGVRDFGGVAYTFHIVNTHNREVKMCRIFRLYLFGHDCGSPTDSVALNAPLVKRMLDRYEMLIKPNIEEELLKFHVSYIMKDKEQDTAFHPEALKNIEHVYEDQRFVIYKLN